MFSNLQIQAPLFIDDVIIGKDSEPPPLFLILCELGQDLEQGLGWNLRDIQEVVQDVLKCHIVGEILQGFPSQLSLNLESHMSVLRRIVVQERFEEIHLLLVICRKNTEMVSWQIPIILMFLIFEIKLQSCRFGRLCVKICPLGHSKVTYWNLMEL